MVARGFGQHGRVNLIDAFLKRRSDTSICLRLVACILVGVWPRVVRFAAGVANVPPSTGSSDKLFGFEQSLADARVMRLDLRRRGDKFDRGSTVLGIFTVGRKSRCVQFGKDLNEYVPISDLREFRGRHVVGLSVIGPQERFHSRSRCLQRVSWRSLLLVKKTFPWR